MQSSVYSPVLRKSEHYERLFSLIDERRLGSAKYHTIEGSELPWRDWLARYFPHVASSPSSPRHERLWEWFDALETGVRPRPRVEPWPRGGGKSTTAELGCVRLGVKLSRRFVLFVSETQPQADQRVQAVAALFERMGVGRAVNRYGASKGWSHDQLRTENGFNVAGIGLEVAARGVKLDEFRPDLIIADDIDNREDKPPSVAKKVRALTNSLLPAGSSDCAVLFLQNLIHRNGIVASLVDGTAEFLHTREASEPEPAVRGLKVDWLEQADGTRRYRITAGTPTWAGQSLATCEGQINDWGLPAFLREAQHEVDDEEGGLWNRAQIAATRWTKELPPLTRIAVGVDPNTKAGGDEAGVIVAAVGMVNGVLHGFVLEDATADGGPKEWSEGSVMAYHKHRADVIVAEANNGGEMVEQTIRTVSASPKVKLVHASRGKITRAEPVQKLYADGRIHHVGVFPDLETQLCTYRPLPGMDSPGRLDAAVWALTELMIEDAGQSFQYSYRSKSRAA